MEGLYLLLPTLIVVLLSFLIVRAGAIALMMTGMDYKRASFQALSAFTRTGFTTREAELVVNHPQRRRIVSWLITLGNAGLVAVIVTATSSITTSQGYQLPISIAVLSAGLYLLYKLSRRRGFVRRWERFIENRLAKSKIFEEVFTEDLLHLVEGYGLVRVIVTPDSPFAGNSLSDMKLRKSDFLILGIERKNQWIPFPKATGTIDGGDKLVVYGRIDSLKGIILEETEKAKTETLSNDQLVRSDANAPDETLTGR